MTPPRPSPVSGVHAPAVGPLPCLRDAFGLPDDLHFLNCAYMSPLPTVAEQAVAAGLRRKRVPTGIRPSDFFEDAEVVRGVYGRLVGGGPESVAILPSASYGVAICARNLTVERGRRVVVTSEQFPGNVYAWRRRAAESGAEVFTVEPGDAGPGRGERWNARVLEAIDGRTAVVAMPHVHWTDGTRFDLEAVGERCRDVGAALVVDATQSVGALPFDVGRVRPDAVVAATYKWLLGPYGKALGWFGERFADGVPLEETWMGREGSEDFQHLVDYRDEYQPGARRYDVGEVADFALLPGVKTSLALVEEWRPERIQAYCRELLRPLVERVSAAGFAVEDERWRAWHIVGIRMRPDVELAELEAELGRRDIVASLRGTALRVSPNVYNRPEDVAALVETLEGV